MPPVVQLVVSTIQPESNVGLTRSDISSGGCYTGPACCQPENRDLHLKRTTADRDRRLSEPSRYGITRRDRSLTWIRRRSLKIYWYYAESESEVAKFKLMFNSDSGDNRSDPRPACVTVARRRHGGSPLGDTPTFYELTNHPTNHHHDSHAHVLRAHSHARACACASSYMYREKRARARTSGHTHVRSARASTHARTGTHSCARTHAYTETRPKFTRTCARAHAHTQTNKQMCERAHTHTHANATHKLTHTRTHKKKRSFKHAYTHTHTTPGRRYQRPVRPYFWGA